MYARFKKENRRKYTKKGRIQEERDAKLARKNSFKSLVGRTTLYSGITGAVAGGYLVRKGVMQLNKETAASGLPTNIPLTPRNQKVLGRRGAVAGAMYGGTLGVTYGALAGTGVYAGLRAKKKIQERDEAGSRRKRRR